MNNEEISVEKVTWQDEENHLRHIRTVVFIEEQHVPENMEWDEHDEECVHVLAIYKQEPVATARLLKTGQVGRMAVLKMYRKQGVGSKILKSILSIADSMNMKSVFLNSQIDAVDFYKKFGFEEEGNIFDDAGIPHLKMKKVFIR